MPRFEATSDDHGSCFIARDGVDVVQLPVVSTLDDTTVCEFLRLDPELSWRHVVGLIQRDLLTVYMGGAYDAARLELVDLDRRRWARVPFGAQPEEADWVSVDEAWPRTS